MKKTPKQNHGGIEGQQLTAICERIEKLNEEKSAISADIKEIMHEAQGAGYDAKYVRAMIKLRAMDPDKLDEQDELTKMYRKAIGL